MALKLGSLYVSLTARTSAFSKGMAGAMGSLERFSKEAKKVSADVAMFSGALSAVGIGAVKLASTVDGPTRTAMKGLEDSTKLLAVQVADMLLPAVRELTGMFKQAAAAVAALDPQTKKQIATFAVMAVQVAAAAKGLSMFAGIASSAFSVLKGAFTMVASVGLAPLIEIALAVGAVVAVVVLLHRAWRKNWGGIQDTTREVLEWLRSGFDQFANFMGKVWDFLVDGAARFIEGLLSVIDTVQELTGKKLVDTGGLREGFAGLWKDLKSGAFFSQAFEFGKSIGQQVADGLSEELAAIKKELGLDKLFGGGSAAKPIPLGRGGPAGPAKSGAVNDAFTQAARGTVNVRAFLDEVDAAARATNLENVASEALRQEMRRRAAAEREAAASADRLALARATGNTNGLTKAERKEFDGQNAAVRNEAVGAGDWGQAVQRLKDGLKGAYTVGDELSVWGARMGPMVARAGQQLLGAVGDLVSSIVEGAQSGGVWGAIIAAFMELAKKTASALKFLDVAMEFVEQIAAMVEPLVAPIFDALTNVLGIVVQIVAPVFKALVPLFTAVGDFVKQLAPIIYALGDILTALSPIIEVIGKVVGLILQALRPVIDLIAGIMKVIATVLLGIIIGLNELAAAFGDEAAKAESARLKGVVEKMWAPSANELAVAEGDAAAAALRNAAAQNDAADSAQEVAESLSNLPSGYKLAHARYQADLGITGSNGLVTAGAGAGGGGSTTVINGDINVSSDAETVDSLAEDARREAARERGQRTGSTRPRRNAGGDW